MKHFSAAAYYADKWYLSIQVVLRQGYRIELDQSESKTESAFSYEDLPSNVLGAYFEDYSSSGSYSNYKSSKSETSIKLNPFQQKLISYLMDLEVVDDPLAIAPNVEDIPKFQGSNKDKPTPQNFRYRPMFTVAPLQLLSGKLDYKILSIVEELKKPTGGYYYNEPVEGGGYIVGPVGASVYHSPGGLMVPEW